MENRLEKICGGVAGSRSTWAVLILKHEFQGRPILILADVTYRRMPRTSVDRQQPSPRNLTGRMR